MTVSSGAGSRAGSAGPVARWCGRIGNTAVRSAWPVRYWLVQSLPMVSALAQTAVPVSVSSAYIS